MIAAENIKERIKDLLSPPNEITLEDLEQRRFIFDWCEEVLAWLEFGESTDWEAPIILPLKLPGEKTTWFASALDSRTASQLSIELLAHIGPSYSDFDGNPLGNDFQNSKNDLFFNDIDNNVYCFTSPSTDQDHDTANNKIASGLKLLRGSLQKRPPRRRISSTSSHLMRSEFDKALLLNDEERALFLKNELVKSGRLSAENKIYLEVRFLAGFGKSKELISNVSLLNKLTDRHLPKQILYDLIISYHSVFIDKIENDENLKESVEEFEISTKNYGTFFKTRRGINDPRLLKTFLLYAVCHRQTKGEDFERLAEEIADSEAFVQKIRDIISPSEGVSSVEEEDVEIILGELEKAKAALLSLDFDRAFSLFLELDPTKDVINYALTCAELIKTQKSNNDVCQFVDASNLDIEKVLEANQKQFYLKIKSEIDNPVTDISSWMDWLELVSSEKNMEVVERLLEDDSGTWSIEPLCSKRSADIILDTHEKHRELTEKAMITIVTQLQDREEFQGESSKPLIETMLIINIAREAHSSYDLEIINQLTQLFLTTGLNDAEYVEVVEYLIEVFDSNASPHNISWALDLLDILATYPCPNNEIRLRFFILFIEYSSRHIHRLDVAQYSTLTFLSSDYNYPLPESFDRSADETEADVQGNYDSVKIGIYTLMEQAGQRAVSILEELYPNITINTNSDHACSSRLRSMSKNSDIIVFCSKVSTHQAFYCIKENQPVEKLFLQPLGKGTASIVKIVAENISMVAN
jgi:hypothetical protein